MSKAYKGGDFEREICKLLSHWWSNGERDDIFWRSSQSGGRATERAKQGKRTYGSYGDIAAVDPIGAPLLKVVTIELKRGSSWGFPSDLIESQKTKAIRPFEAALEQAIESAGMAGSLGWMLICRRDHRVAMVYLDDRLVQECPTPFLRPPAMRFDMMVNWKDSSPRRVTFSALPLSCFLSRVSPEQIIELSHE